MKASTVAISRRCWVFLRAYVYLNAYLERISCEKLRSTKRIMQRKKASNASEFEYLLFDAVRLIKAMTRNKFLVAHFSVTLCDGP